ncbi:hypothetical protein BGZ49_001803 [Haplosporangium sp. Z 27]|nr:hypothetical protein BGZ49_001803 [Haplosporangium sp. Z 27]
MTSATVTLSLSYVVDGSMASTTFPVVISSNENIGALKRLIRNDIRSESDTFRPNDLILWHVNISANEESSLHINKKLLMGEVAISEYFDNGASMKTIHIIVEKAKVISERQFVQHVPPPITGMNQGPDGSSRSTRRRYLVAPTSISLWAEFLTEVNGMPPDDTPHYSAPSFMKDRGFYVESTVTAMFANDIGSVRNLEPLTWTRATPTPAIMNGKPDLTRLRQQNNQKLFSIVVKRPYVLALNDNATFPRAYLTGRHLTTGPIQPSLYVRFLDTCFTWFIKRIGQDGEMDRNTRDIVVSPTINHNQHNPTLLQSYLWFIRLTANDINVKMDPPNKQTIRKVTNESYKEKGPTQFRKSQHQPEAVTVPSFVNMELIAPYSSERASTYSVCWRGEEVVVKKCDIWKRPHIMEELEHEARIYEVLKLQGKWIPMMKIAGVSNRIDMVLVTEYWGYNIRNVHLRPSGYEKIRTALSKIHQLGVLHGDKSPGNILIRRDGPVTCFSIIDLGFSKLTSDNGSLQEEKKRIGSTS